MKRNSNSNLAILGLLIFVVGVAVVIIEYQTTRYSLPAPTSPSRPVSANSIGWVEKWRRPLLLAGNKSTTGAITNEVLIVPVQVAGGMRLSALNAANGYTRWEQEADAKQARLESLDSLAADQDRVYVISSFALSAYHAVDGRPLWTTLAFYAHTTGEILPLAGTGVVQVQVLRSLGGATLYAFDAQSGSAKSTQESRFVLKLKTDAATYYLGKDFDLLSIDNQSGQTLWTVKTRGMSGKPSLTDANVLVIQSGPFLTKLVGLDPASGKMLWQTAEENIASNFLVLADTVYALTTKPAIVGYDVLTGHEKNRLTFGGEALDVQHAPNFWLLSDDSHVFAYFSDSQELIAFEQQ